MTGNLPYQTQSLCPQCLKRIDARHRAEGEAIYLEKTCPDHGDFKTRIWQGRQLYARWVRPKIPIERRFTMTQIQDGCPFDCGLCPDHRQHTCTAVLDITHRCNLNCRFCFADAGAQPAEDPDLSTLAALMEKVIAVSPDCNLQLSGGEPSLREDLPQIVAAARQIGFRFVQLNTNGMKLGEDPGFTARLAEAGLASLFLQFDGVTDTVYDTLRGRPLLEVKQAAIRACADSGIGVVLVPTLVSGINIHEIGRIIEFGLAHAPAVRGVHFQPVSYFGRHGAAPKDSDRITIPEVLDALEKQTHGKICVNDFKPSACEHALCSFTGKFLRKPDGSLSRLTLLDTACCTPVRAEQGSRRAKEAVVRHWQTPNKPGTNPPGTTCKCQEDGLDRFLREASQGMFTVSGMAFQDVWNLDLERLKGCCIHAVSPDGRLIPFCAYNLTSALGKGLHRHHG